MTNVLAFYNVCFLHVCRLSYINVTSYFLKRRETLPVTSFKDDMAVHPFPFPDSCLILCCPLSYKNYIGIVPHLTNCQCNLINITSIFIHLQKLEFDLGTAPLKAGDELQVFLKDWEMMGRNRYIPSNLIDLK